MPVLPKSVLFTAIFLAASIAWEREFPVPARDAGPRSAGPRSLSGNASARPFWPSWESSFSPGRPRACTVRSHSAPDSNRAAPFTWCRMRSSSARASRPPPAPPCPRPSRGPAGTVPAGEALGIVAVAGAALLRWRSRSSSACGSSSRGKREYANQQNESGPKKGRRRVATGANHPASLSSAFRRGPGTPAAVPRRGTRAPI